MTTAWTRIFLIYGTGVLAAGQLGVVAPLLPALQDELAVPFSTVGLILSAITAVGAVLGFAAGETVERIGYGRALVIGLAILMVATGVGAFADSGAALLATRIGAGVGYLLIVVAAPSLMTHLALERDQKLALALWGTFVPFGIAVAQALAAALVHALGWRGVLLADAGVLALALVVVWRATRTEGRARVAPTSIAQHLSPRALMLAMGFFCFALTFLAVAGLLTTYFVAQRGFGVAQAGSVIAAATSLGAAGSLAAGVLMRRGVPPSWIGAAGLLLSMGLTPFMFSTLPGDGLAIAAVALSFIIGGVVPAAAFAAVPLLAREARAIGPLNGLIAQAGSLGSLGGPPLVALFVDTAGWAMAPALLLALAGVGSLCLLASGVRVRPRIS
jgi:MFS family permease